MKKMIIVMALFAASISQAKSTEVIKNEKEACLKKASSTRDMIECSASALEDSDAELKVVYERIKSSVEARGDEDSQEISSRLVKAQDAWAVFRDANCELAASDMLGGSGESMLRIDCLADSTIKRVDELNIMFTEK